MVFKAFILVFSTLVTVRCATVDSIDTNTPKGKFEKATELAKYERYDEAIGEFSDLKNKYPYNSLAKEAELSIADIHFKREAYVEAESAYKVFKEFHPRHPKIDYVTFKIAMSMFKQLPESIDKDLNMAQDAIIFFRQVHTNYPESDYADSAREHELLCRTRLARSIYYIAEFYFKREKFDSALGRFQELLKDFSDTSLIPSALYGAAISAYKIDKADLSKTYYEELVKSHPQSRWAKRIQKDINKKELKW
jgi:outer membrane protein assembly factor BamD